MPLFKVTLGETIFVFAENQKEAENAAVENSSNGDGNVLSTAKITATAQIEKSDLKADVVDTDGIFNDDISVEDFFALRKSLLA